MIEESKELDALKPPDLWEQARATLELNDRASAEFGPLSELIPKVAVL